MHYTNPTHRSDIVDSSGISIGLTSHLRVNDAGLMPMGPHLFRKLVRIPPNVVREELGA